MVKNVGADWNREETALLKKLNSPYKVQEFLNEINYNPVIECQSPRYIIKKRRAHCFEGALFAAACLRFQGYKPLVVDLKAFNDDDHVIAVFKVNNHWGAVAKSNFTTLRFREPVYKNLRELVMSYFDFYFNSLGDKTLRSYSLPMNLAKYDTINWMTTGDDLDILGQELEKVRHIPVISKTMTRSLKPVDPDLVKAGLLGSNPSGLYKPKK